jgi:NitT/TauT family transport system substrate-binding protein
MRRVRLLALLLGATAVVLCPGCGGEPRAPLRIAISPWPGYELLYLAQERGFFADSGVDVRIVEMASLGDARRAFERGQVDGMAVTLVELLESRAHDAPRSPQAVMVTAWSDGADVLVARPPVRSLAELRGRRVGIQPGSLGALVLARALESVDLGLADVVPVFVDETRMAQALASGTVHAVVTYPPFSTAMRNVTDAVTLFDSRAMPREIVDVVALDAPVVAADHDRIRRLAEAFDRTVRFTREQPDVALGIMAQREGIPPAVFREQLQQIRLVELEDQPTLLAQGGPIDSTLRTLDGLLRRLGRLSGPSRLDDCLVPAPVTVASGR